MQKIPDYALPPPMLPDTAVFVRYPGEDGAQAGPDQEAEAAGTDDGPNAGRGDTVNVSDDASASKSSNRPNSSGCQGELSQT